MPERVPPVPPLRSTAGCRLIPCMPPALREHRTVPDRSEADSSFLDIGELLARAAALDEVTIARQLTIAGIAAPTGDEGERAAWFAESLQALGAGPVTRDGAGNVVCSVQGSEALEPVVVLSHLDTVFPRTPAPSIRREGQRLIGAGINDNARGLAVMLAIAEELAAGVHQARRPIVLVGTTCEEGAGDLRGAKHYFARQPQAAAAIALDGAGDDRIVHCGLGARRFRITFDGPGGHSWSAYGVPNAVNAAAVCAARLARLHLPGQPRASLSVGRIGGGLCVNAIPDHAWLEVDVRSPDRPSLDWLEREVYRAVQDAQAEENGRRTRGGAVLTAAVERFGNRPPGETPADDGLVRVAVAATQAIGRTPELAVASTDANVPMSLGIPAIAIGAGGTGGDAHTEHEWFENVEGPRGIARALAIILAAANA